MTTLDQIRARTDAATEGPWEAHQGFGCWAIQSDSCDEIAIIPDRPGIDDDPQAEANAAAIINAHYDRRDLLAAVDAVLALHQRVPVYETWASDCGHDDCVSVEADDGETYCPESIVAYTCYECSALSKDNMDGDLPEWPCRTVQPITQALEGAS